MNLKELKTNGDLSSMFLTAEKFYFEVNKLVEKEGMTYFDATIKVCENKNIEYEDVKKLKLIAPILYGKLYKEATENKMLKATDTPLC